MRILAAFAIILCELFTMEDYCAACQTPTAGTKRRLLACRRSNFVSGIGTGKSEVYQVFMQGLLQKQS
jgi:hypothetical protein